MARAEPALLEMAPPVGGGDVGDVEPDGPTGVWDTVPDGAMVVALLEGVG